MSWIRLVIVFWTSQPHFIYLVHSRAGLQSKLGNHYSTEDNLKIWRLDPVCLWHTWPGRPGRKKSQIYISNRIKIAKVRCSSSQLVKIETINNEGPISTPFLGGLFWGACFPRKFWNFKAVKCIHQLTERERERERQ